MTRYFQMIDGKQTEIAQGSRIESQHPRQVGETFVAQTSLLTKIGSVFGLTHNGQRYGSARVVGEPCKDPKYQVNMQRQGGMNNTNMADHQYEFQVEHSDYDGNCAPGDRWNTSA